MILTIMILHSYISKFISLVYNMVDKILINPSIMTEHKKLKKYL